MTGLIGLNTGRWKEALAFFEQALVEQPGFEAALYNRVRALRHLGKYAEAFAVSEQAL